MIDRRAFLRRAGILATGLIAADQLDILERLTHRRRFFPGWTPYSYGALLELHLWDGRPLLTEDRGAIVRVRRRYIGEDVLRMSHLNIGGWAAPMFSEGIVVGEGLELSTTSDRPTRVVAHFREPDGRHRLGIHTIPPRGRLVL